jgi:hypothetical protein
VSSSFRDEPNCQSDYRTDAQGDAQRAAVYRPGTQQLVGRDGAFLNRTL